MFTDSRSSTSVTGTAIPGVHDRQVGIPGFSQSSLGRTRVLCIGAGGLMAFIAPTLVRKGVGAITVIDHDHVESSNLNRQRFYVEDIGEPKAFALVKNLARECFSETTITGHRLYFTEAVEQGIDLSADVVICGVDNNQTRIEVAGHFRATGTPVIFCAVSADADHGYVFVQEGQGPCLGCLFPDSVNDDRYPCPGTPAMADILQAVGSLVVYAVDSLVMARPRNWNYRTVHLSDGNLDGSQTIATRQNCPLPH
ncbi:MAG: hypothetical protein FJW31_21050 [Acidobacteria bacterium]|nr:hypothetical protein [Acidobacteriota bacterium]